MRIAEEWMLPYCRESNLGRCFRYTTCGLCIYSQIFATMFASYLLLPREIVNVCETRNFTSLYSLSL